MRVLSTFSPAAITPNKPDGTSIWALRIKYHALHKRIGLGGDPDHAFRSLVKDYSAPGRHYHTLMHVADCLQQFEQLRRLLPAADHDLVRLALWYHDRVFDPRQADNEQQSARKSVEELILSNAPVQLLAPIHHLIMVTGHQQPPTQINEQVLADIDLRPLALAPRYFRRNTDLLRAEYADVGLSKAQFNNRCMEFFNRLLERPSIYSADRYHRHEKKARENMERTLELFEKE